MPKITVHGGPTNAAAGPSITGGGWGAPTDDAAPAEPALVGDQVTGYDPNNLTLPDGPGDPYTEGAAGTRYYEPQTLESDGDDGGVLLPAVEDDAAAAIEYEASFDYEACNVTQLREFLKARELPTAGLKPELVERLTADDLAGAAVKASEES